MPINRGRRDDTAGEKTFGRDGTGESIGDGDASLRRFSNE